MGDPAGIGPEIIVKTLSIEEIYTLCKPVVIGDSQVIERAKRHVKNKIKTNLITDISDGKFELGTINIYNLNNVRIDELKIGQIQAMAGKASVEYVQKAVELALNDEIDAIVTAPINKEAMNKAGFNYAGHTEILAELTNTEDYAMMLIAGLLRVIHVTTHISLRKACASIKKDKVLNTIKMAHKVLLDLGFENPRIAVAGLNPHAGEGGLFGREEIEEISPAINSAEKMGINVHGPYPPDTIFLRTHKGEFDVTVAMYHDQGHIATKMVGFSTGVNYTVGLPIIRTSVDHGTAYDIVKSRPGSANPRSLIEAIKLATKLANQSTKSQTKTKNHLE